MQHDTPYKPFNAKCSARLMAQQEHDARTTKAAINGMRKTFGKRKPQRAKSTAMTFEHSSEKLRGI